MKQKITRLLMCTKCDTKTEHLVVYIALNSVDQRHRDICLKCVDSFDKVVIKQALEKIKDAL